VKRSGREESWIPPRSGWETEEGLSSYREPDLQELQEMQCFLTAQKRGLIANQTETRQFAANLHFVNVPDCK